MTMPEPHKGTPVFDEAHFPTLSAKIIAPWSAYGASSAFCKCICAIGHLIAFLKRPLDPGRPGLVLRDQPHLVEPLLTTRNDQIGMR